LIFSQTNAQRLALFGVSVRFQSSRQAQVQAWPSVGTSDQLLILRCNGALNVANLCLDNIAVLLTPDHVRDNIADAKSLVRLVLLEVQLPVLGVPRACFEARNCKASRS